MVGAARLFHLFPLEQEPVLVGDLLIDELLQASLGKLAADRHWELATR